MSEQNKQDPSIDQEAMDKIAEEGRQEGFDSQIKGRIGGMTANGIDYGKSAAAQAMRRVGVAMKRLLR